MSMNINFDIARTYIFSNKRLTLVASMGVVLGMSIYIFMNSMMVGFDKSSNASIFKSTAHIRVYKEDVVSQNLVKDSAFYLIINPKIVPQNNTIVNPKMVVEMIQKQEQVKIVAPQVNSNVFYKNGKSQISGVAVGILPEEANQMYQIETTLVEGSFQSFKNNAQGILIGSGIAEKMNIHQGDHISLNSSKGIDRTYKVMGIFKTNNSIVDKTKSYIHLHSAQQLLKEGSSFVSEINVNVQNPEEVEEMAWFLSQLTGYKAESWKQANETLMAAFRMRKIIITFVSFTILLVAGFGIYNILNMTVTQKINDIAILKAMGFNGRDVIQIFVTQALSIGIMGVIGGMGVAVLLVTILKNVYVGGDIGYFPIDYEITKFIQGVFIGLVITFFAGYIPAKKASKVDPVSIFRK